MRGLQKPKQSDNLKSTTKTEEKSRGLKLNRNVLVPEESVNLKIKDQQLFETETALFENIQSILTKYQENLASTLTKQIGLDINQAYE